MAFSGKQPVVRDEVEKLDKYEYNLKLEEIDKLVDQGDYEEAAKMADTIDWRRVRNVRTLCLISEIYEASGRLEDSKNLLIRAYKKSPVGKTILYRLVEVTTAMQQYDEALEYYSEYVQAAPHDNSRYILKYMIYRGRGSSPEELITILEEYLGQEYTERWAYELAKLYQQAGQMQKCFAACDDLVLWFHSGKYVRKALELKQRYTTLTPRQQQIYEECLQEELEPEFEEPEEEKDTVIQSVPETDGEVIAESIIAETEREIAGEVTAHKAQMERQAAGVPAGMPGNGMQPMGGVSGMPQNGATGTPGNGMQPTGGVSGAWGGATGIPENGMQPTGGMTGAWDGATGMPGNGMQPTGGTTGAWDGATGMPQNGAAGMPGNGMQPTGGATGAWNGAVGVPEGMPQNGAAGMPENGAQPVTGNVPGGAPQNGAAGMPGVQNGAAGEPGGVPQDGAARMPGNGAPSAAGATPGGVPQNGAAGTPGIQAQQPGTVLTQETRVMEPVQADTAASQPAAQIPPYDEKDLKVELAKSMREIISGVVRRNTDNNDEDIPASVDSRLHRVQKLEIPEAREPVPGKLSIDDILLSMGERGRKIAAEAMRAEAERTAADQTSPAEPGGTAADQISSAEPDGTAADQVSARSNRSTASQASAGGNGEGEAQTFMEPNGTAAEQMTETSNEMAADQSSARSNGPTASQASAGANEAGTGQAFAKSDDQVAGPAQTADGVDVPQAESGEMAEEQEEQAAAKPVKTVMQAAAEELTDAQREALQYTSNPERLLRNRNALPTYIEEPRQTRRASDLGATRRMASKEELAEAARQEILAGKTIRIPTEEIARRHSRMTAEEFGNPQSGDEKREGGAASQAAVGQRGSKQEPNGGTMASAQQSETAQKKSPAAGRKFWKGKKAPKTEEWSDAGDFTDERSVTAADNAGHSGQAAGGGSTGSGYAGKNGGFSGGQDSFAGGTGYTDADRDLAGETGYAGGGSGLADGTGYAGAESGLAGGTGYTGGDRDFAGGSYTGGESDLAGGAGYAGDESGYADDGNGFADRTDYPDGTGFAGEMEDLDGEYDPDQEMLDDYEEEEYLRIPEHLRNLFSGFTEIEGLEDQIANAIIQAEAKGEDRTSRSGNILIFGGHGTGKTTLAMNIAKAVAQDKGNQVMKMAKIYASDLNRKDIAATVARIAGGTLIIEEAGDLEPNTVEQLTTAMEFRTDGLIVILEDDQQYIHDLLMKHPRFTMKFTAQIYIPVYTPEELAMFGQMYARAQDYVISEEALDVLYDQISAMAASGTAAAISDVIEMVARAIQNANKFFRKVSMGKKRYDENDYIILFPKDFK